MEGQRNSIMYVRKHNPLVLAMILYSELIVSYTANSSECVEGEKDCVCSCQCVSLHLPGQQWSCLHLWQRQRSPRSWRLKDKNSTNKSTEFGSKYIGTVYSTKVGILVPSFVSIMQLLLLAFSQDIKIVSAAAGVSKSIFISSGGFGYWCGEGMGQLKNVSLHNIHCH